MSDPIARPNTDAIEAAAFRHLVRHLRHRTDVQNIDLMAVAGFCRNCLGDWLEEAAAEQGVALDKDSARTRVYGMSQAEWKAQFQTPATDAQLAAMAASVARNNADAELDEALDEGFPASDPPSATQP
jgi:uncharacterized protein